MVMVPATVSNNVPGSDFSIGADTALNTITDVSAAGGRAWGRAPTQGAANPGHRQLLSTTLEAEPGFWRFPFFPLE